MPEDELGENVASSPLFSPTLSSYLFSTSSKLPALTPIETQNWGAFYFHLIMFKMLNSWAGGGVDAGGRTLPLQGSLDTPPPAPPSEVPMSFGGMKKLKVPY